MSGDQGKEEKRLTDELTRLRDDLRKSQVEQEQLRTAVNEKDTLLREFHHRIKNNLQVISGLLNIQSLHMSDVPAREALRESQDRIRAIAIMHESIYRSPDLISINMDEYIRTLMEKLFEAYKVDPESITLEMDLDGVNLPVATAVPCGLIINEIATNSLKYAFPDGRRGRMALSFHQQDGDEYKMTISDDGIGFPEETEPGSTGSLGLKLVLAMAEQLSARVDMTTTGGASFIFVFQKYEEVETLVNEPPSFREPLG